MIEVVYLGVGAASPEAARGLPAIIVRFESGLLLMDVGEGTQERMLRAGFSPLKLSVILVTHLHGDHFFGLPGLLQYMTLHGRREALTIIGPRGLEEFIRKAEEVSGHVRSFDINFVEVNEGVVLDTREYRIRAFEVCHARSSYGYRVEVKGREYRVDVEKLLSMGLKPGPYIRRLMRGETVVIDGRVLKPNDVLVPVKQVSIFYTGDTEPCSSIIDGARRASLLIHDATFHSSDWSEAREKKHSTAAEAAIDACEARVDYLALFHVSGRYRDLSFLAADARRYFRRVYVAEPMMRHILA